jgi:hypothetical protein
MFGKRWAFKIYNLLNLLTAISPAGSSRFRQDKRPPISNEFRLIISVSFKNVCLVQCEPSLRIDKQIRIQVTTQQYTREVAIDLLQYC